ncbi:unnamed protein product, partial [Gulo gulo]
MQDCHSLPGSEHSLAHGMGMMEELRGTLGCGSGVWPGNWSPSIPWAEPSPPSRGLARYQDVPWGWGLVLGRSQRVTCLSI